MRYFEQDMLPLFKEPLRVEYAVGEEVPLRGLRNRIMGRKVVRQLVDETEWTFSAVRRSVLVDDLTLNTFSDRDVLYALRFAAAAATSGDYYKDEDDSLVCAYVNVTLSDEGKDSRLLESQYHADGGEEFLSILKRARSS